MSVPFPKSLRLPSRVALLIGLGAVSTAAAPADASLLPCSGGAETSQAERVSGLLRVWSEDGRLYVSEQGGSSQLLALGDSTEARHLHRLLKQRAAETPNGIQIDRFLLAGGGGDGFHWAPAARNKNSGNPAVTGAAAQGKPKPKAPGQAPASDAVRFPGTNPERPQVKG
jgi:hypothetical protein